MQNKILKISLILLGLLLPLHGLISVIGESINFNQIRYWKELILIFLIMLVGLKYFSKNITEPATPLPRGEAGRGILTSPLLPLILLFFWALVLWLIHGHTSYHTIALRYLLEPLIFFAVIYLLFLQVPLDKGGFRGIFSQFFLLGSLLSLLFGTWAKFFGGFEILQNFYSHTISSWVPGQTLPIYHQTGEFIRMQGASSGPVAFGYLQFFAFFIIFSSLIFPRRPLSGVEGGGVGRAFLKIFLLLCFTLGIYQSGSRAAILAQIFLIIFFTIYFLRQRFFPYSKISPLQKSFLALTLVKVLLGCIIFFASLDFIVSKIPENFSHKFSTRLGDIDHITKPIEAISLGLQNPITGNLSQIGPAARMRNLAENNNDYALLAENIFADFFAQLGIIGLLLFLWFWLNVFLKTNLPGKVFVIASAFLGSLATIFDMTPIAITMCILFVTFLRAGSPLVGESGRGVLIK